MGNWSFGRVQGGVTTGFRNGGMDHFVDFRLDRMVRECIQNSLDAKDEDQDGPVHVSLTLSQMAPNQDDYLTGLDRFYALGQNQATNTGDTEKHWYNAARSTIQKPTVALLGIHDANTIGLRGTTDKTANQPSRWLALVAGQGINLGQGGVGLGGFGHGSNAAFAMSRLRTAFYLTKTEDENDHEVSRFQGHCLLQTLITPERVQTTPDGFYGELRNEYDCDPLVNENVPDFFRSIRSQAVGDGKGTSVFVCDPYFDVENQQSWNEIFVSVVANFAFAIYQGSLKVTLGDGNVIERDTLVEAYRRAAQFESNLEMQANVDEVTWRNLESCKTLLYPDFPSEGNSLAINNFGQIYWFLRIGNDVTGKTVSVAREPGMTITSDAPALTNRSFGKYREFNLLVCVRRGSGQSNSGAHIIKQMENPPHTKLEFGLVSEENLPIVRTKYNAFAKAVKSDILDKYAMAEIGEAIDIEIEGLLAPSFAGEKDTVDSFREVVVTKGAKSKRTPKWPVPDSGKNEGISTGQPPVGEGGEGGPGAEGGSPPPDPSGTFEVKGARYERSDLKQLQIIPTGNAKNDFVELRIVGHQLKKGQARLSLFVAGETQTEPLEMRVNPAKALNASEKGTVAFSEGDGGRQEAIVWIPAASMNVAFGGELYRGV